MKLSRWTGLLILAAVTTSVSPGLTAQERFSSSVTLTEVGGELRARDDSILLDFSSRQLADTGIELQVSYAGAQFLGSYHPDANLFRIHGFGAQVLPEDAKLIQRGHDELIRRHGAADHSNLTHFLLERLLLLLSDAPAGFVWDEMELEVGVERQGVVEERAIGQELESFLGELGAKSECTERADDETATIGCSAAIRDTHHDACPAHGFDTFRVETGCKASIECMGRCGPGCGIGILKGTGRYAKDCADHDKCCDDHGSCLNPLAAECGDEFREAADDFLRLSNCFLCTGDASGQCSSAVGGASGTWVVGKGESASRLQQQLEWSEGRVGQRGERFFVYEQWALQASGTILASSDDRFGSAAGGAIRAGIFRPGFERGSALIVQAPIHPMDEKWIPRPGVIRWQGTLSEVRVKGAPQSPPPEIWFRAEISKEGTVDAFRLLGSNPHVSEDLVHQIVVDEALASLVFEDERRHRVVLFGRLHFSRDEPGGGIDYRLAEVLTVLPRCCTVCTGPTRVCDPIQPVL